MNWAAIVWLALFVLFLVAEGASVMVVSLWFAIGALVAMAASLLGAEVWLQVVLFLVVSVALLLALRPLTKKFFTPKLSRTNVDAVVGKTGIVLDRIDNVDASGRVKMDGMEWTARSTTGEIIAPGKVVKVDKVEGVKVFVTPVRVETNV